VYSESAVDRVRLLLPFLLQILPQSLPHLATSVSVEPNELVFADVEDRGTASRLLGVNERQADGDDFAGLASVTGFVDRSNWLIRRKRAARAAPQERWQFVDLGQSGNVVSWLDVFSSDACCHVRREVGFACGFHDSFRLMKVVLNVQIAFAGARLLGAGFRNGEEVKLHTHGYSHEQMKMKTADEVMCQR
jgi:hypothetical protein